MIAVTADPSRRLVRALMSGFLTVEEVHQFSRDEQAAVREMGLGSGEFLLLIIAQTDVVQTQEVMAAFQELIVTSTFKAARIATVRSGALARMQTRRVTSIRDDTAVFESVADAERWLFNANAPA